MQSERVQRSHLIDSAILRQYRPTEVFSRTIAGKHLKTAFALACTVTLGADEVEGGPGEHQ